MKKTTVLESTLCKRILAITLCVCMLVMACGCGKSYPKIKYTSISTESTERFDLLSNSGEKTSEDIFSNDASSVLFCLTFLLSVSKEESLGFDLNEIDLNGMYIAVCTGNNRIDAYAPYDDNQIIGIQYWPSKSKAQVGTVETEYDILSYLDLLKECNFINSYNSISFDDMF